MCADVTPGSVYEAKHLELVFFPSLKKQACFEWIHFQYTKSFRNHLVLHLEIIICKFMCH